MSIAHSDLVSMNRPMAWRAGTGALLLVASLLSACGGGGGTSPPPVAVSKVEPAVQGRLYPATAGVVLEERAADGRVIQVSSTSLADGSFTFMHLMSGTRVTTVSSPDMDHVRPAFGARLSAGGAVALEVTPLTTWHDRLLVQGLTPKAATESISQVALAACTQKGQAPDLTHVYADLPDRGAQHDWLLSALGAYHAAAGHVGLGPDVDALGWQEMLARRTDLLGSMCSQAATLSDDAAREAVREILTAQGDSTRPDAALLDRSLAEARSEALAATALRAQWLEYPDEAALLAPRRQSPSRAGTLMLAAALYRQFRALPTSELSLVSANAERPRATLAGDGSVGYRMGVSVDTRLVPNVKLMLENKGAASRSLELAINSHTLGDLPEVISEIMALPVAFHGEPLYRKAWRHVATRAQRSVPLAVGMFQHQPDLWLRSVGTSFCDAQATALYWIWSALGHEARVVGLTGHVTAEIRVDGRWQLLDPYLGVIYLDRQGNPAGVAALEQDPSLITRPQNPTRPLDDVAYSSVVADIFASKDDNFIQDRYMMPLPQPFGSTWTLPAGARLELLPGLPLLRPSSEPGYAVAVGAVRLWLPPGYSGTLPLPLLLADAAGDAEFTMLGQRLNTRRDPVGLLLNDFYLTQVADVGITELQIDRVGDGGLMLTLMLSPHHAESSESLSAIATGSNLTDLQFSLGTATETSN